MSGSRTFGTAAAYRTGTRFLMGASALFMAICGAGALFLPQEILQRLGTTPTPPVTVVVQTAGALYLGFAILNWMARGVLIGGIYSRPLVLGNFLHFAVVAITLLKMPSELAEPPMIGWMVAYCLLAIGFGVVLFTNPLARAGVPNAHDPASRT